MTGFRTEWSKRLGYHIDSKLVSNLMYWRNMTLKHNADCAIIVDGVEGSGKSTLALQIARFLDRDHELDLETQVHFEADELLKAARSLPPGKAIVYDEAGEGLDKYSTGAKKHKMLKRLFEEVRARNLFFILVLPSFYELSRWFALHRTRALVHVYWVPNITDVEEEKRFDRGYYSYYNESGKKRLYVTDKIRKEYLYPRRWGGQDLVLFWNAKFSPVLVVDEASYERKKRGASTSLNEKEDAVPVDWRRECVRVLVGLDERRLVKHGWITGAAAIMGRSGFWITKAVREARENADNTTRV